MVADEGKWYESLKQLVVALERSRKLEEVAVVERAADRLPDLVLGDRVHCGCLDRGGVDGVNDFTKWAGLGVGDAHS